MDFVGEERGDGFADAVVDAWGGRVLECGLKSFGGGEERTDAVDDA